MKAETFYGWGLPPPPAGSYPVVFIRAGTCPTRNRPLSCHMALEGHRLRVERGMSPEAAYASQGGDAYARQVNCDTYPPPF